MDWPKEVVLEFLDCYENEPIIWNASLPAHKNRNEVHDAWKRIELKMGQKYSVTELKTKKRSLMASYRAVIYKLKENKKNGTDDLFKPSWFAYEKMASFLQNKNEPRQTINSEDLEEGCDSDVEEEEDSVNTESELGLDNIENEAMVLSSGSRSLMKSSLGKRKKVAETDEIKNKMDHAYPIIQAVLKKPAKEKNICTIFGELVAAKLQAMDEHTREICMNQIHNLLFEMKMNSCESSSNYSPLQPCQQYNN